jgi:hypothetical protein
VGEVFRWAFAPLSKLFEFKITGSLNAPTYKMVYPMGLLNDIVHPFRTLKGLLPPESPAAPPSAPAAPPTK